MIEVLMITYMVQIILLFLFILFFPTGIKNVTEFLLYVSPVGILFAVFKTLQYVRTKHRHKRHKRKTIL